MFARSAESVASAVVPVKLATLTAAWPEALRKEAADLGDVTVEFPREELGNVMKSGKVVFTWGQLRSWMKPSVGSSASDNTALSLPLRVLVQPFMAQMRSADAGKKAGDSPAATFVNRAPTPALTVPTPPAPAAPAPVDTRLGEALGKPEKAHWTPTEIIHAVCALPGVFGAMLSLQEGQLAAAEMQATLPPELLAYALPKLFSTTAEQARQMKLGEPNSVSLVADQHHWVVFKLDKIFFTVMSRKGHLLPLPQLQTIAHEIGRQRK
jgi:predicted regulator of Ras-like GTPase activity (Roadblock/LC7/MglB family)